MAVKYYKSCTTLPIYNFYKIVDDTDLRFLVIGYSEIDNEYVEITSELKVIVDNIIQEYSELTSNNEVIVNFNLQIIIEEQEFERNTLKAILDIFNESKDFTVLELLSEFGFNVNKDSDLDYEFQKVIKRIKGLNNKIRVNKSKYASRFKKAKLEIKRNLDKEALLLEMNLNLGREIDVHKTSVSKWVNMINMSRERSAEAEKIRNK